MSKIVTNDDINKWLKRIETAGTSANAFGWLMLGLTPLIVLLYSTMYPLDMPTIITIWIIGLALFGFYIYSGKYIKTMRGRAVGGFLLFNAVSSLLLVRGLIPLILCVQSFIGYSGYRKVRKTDIVIKVDEYKAMITTKEIIVFTAIAIMGTVIIITSLSANQSKSFADKSANTPEITAKKALMDLLTSQYETCSSSLIDREKTIDKTSQQAIDAYNSDFDKCETIRLSQNKVVDEYNALIGQ